MRSDHSRVAFAALDKLMANHYLNSERKKDLGMRYSEMNFDQLRHEMIAAEDGMMFADEAKDYVAMSRWREILDEIWPVYVEAIQADEPHTTEADIRDFEGFKYV